MPDMASLNLDNIKQDAQIKAYILRQRPAVVAEIFGRQSQKTPGTSTREMVSSMSVARSHERQYQNSSNHSEELKEPFSREEKEVEVNITKCRIRIVI